MSFWIVLKNGTRFPFKVRAIDADVALFLAQRKLGVRDASHALPAE